MSPEKPITNTLIERMKQPIVIRTAAHFVVVFVLLCALLVYQKYSGGVGVSFSFLKIEFPLIIIAFFALYLPQQDNRFRLLNTGGLLLLFYYLYDQFFIAFGRVFQYTDIYQLPELVEVMPLSSLITLLPLPLLVLGYLINLRWQRPLHILLAWSPWILILFGLNATPNHIASTYKQFAISVRYNEQDEARLNGYLATTINKEANRRVALEKVENFYFSSKEGMHLKLPEELVTSDEALVNVHLIVLESLFDPTFMSALEFSRPVRDKNFDTLIAGNSMQSKASVFGGMSAQSEFEVLCGAPALQELGSIEFNRFTGRKVNCLPRILNQSNYQTIASNAVKPSYFNSLLAYQGIGFTETHFPREYYSNQNSYLRTEGAKQLFDGDLFQQNIQFLQNRLPEKQPLLNYVVGIYGHAPYELDPTRHPTFITASVEGQDVDEALQRAVNQYHYRTKALFDYLQQLIRMDPDSLIIVIGDHLPKLADGKATYKKYRYLDNKPDAEYFSGLYVFRDGQPIGIAQQMRHYYVPQLIIDYLSGHSFCEQNKCEAAESYLVDRYRSLMQQAVK